MWIPVEAFKSHALTWENSLLCGTVLPVTGCLASLNMQSSCNHCAEQKLSLKLAICLLRYSISSLRTTALNTNLSNLPVAQLHHTEPLSPPLSHAGCNPSDWADGCCPASCWYCLLWLRDPLLWFCMSLAAHSFTYSLPLAASSTKSTDKTMN